MNDTAKKRSFLDQKGTIALSDWVRANHATLTTEKATQAEAASRASRALSRPISPSNVYGIVNSLGLPPFWPVASHMQARSSAQEVRELTTRVEGLEAAAKAHEHAIRDHQLAFAQAERRVMHLEDELSRLMLHIINNGSKNGLIQLQSSHVESVRRMRGPTD